ncbi:hypothetical protein P4K96_24310 [Bacillus cereus]|nr:hypothetical protein [Paenibacillus melissococcoides]MEB9896561.1 hypothetical protein [Bacillus cereus]CAH8703453.1 hypothetical protein HTL2_000117 [Paenibacillus melissococcoides]
MSEAADADHIHRLMQKLNDFEALLETARPSTLEWLRKAKNYVKYANQTGAYNDVEDYLRTYGRRI